MSLFHWKNSLLDLTNNNILLGCTIGFSTVKVYTNKPLFYSCRVRLFSTSSVVLTKYLRPNDNAFLVKLDLNCKELYNNLPDNSVLKRSDSLINKRIKLTDLEVLQILYGLKSDKDIQNIFTIPDKLDIPGIYCFMSKDRSNLSYYIGSSVNMRGRYNLAELNMSYLSLFFYKKII